MNPDRRKLIGGSLGIASVALFESITDATASSTDIDNAIKTFAGVAQMNSELVSLNVPAIASADTNVPVAVDVQSPMIAVDFVESITLYAIGSPTTELAKFEFTPASGLASASTRVRLSHTQNLLAVAKMSDGSTYANMALIQIAVVGASG